MFKARAGGRSLRGWDVFFLVLLQNDDETIWRVVVWFARGGGKQGEVEAMGRGGATQQHKWLSSAARCEGQTDVRRCGEQTNELHISR